MNCRRIPKISKSQFEMDEVRGKIEMLLEKWDKEKSNQGLNLYLASQKFALGVATKDNTHE